MNDRNKPRLNTVVVVRSIAFFHSCHCTRRAIDIVLEIKAEHDAKQFCAPNHSAGLSVQRFRAAAATVLPASRKASGVRENMAI
jgi:hypothetical protein